MKAIVRRSYGGPDVLRLEDVDIPEVGEDQVLVRVHAVGVNPYDWHMMRGEPYFMRLMTGLRGPKQAIGGSDVAGRVEAVGRNVTRWRPGDEVYGGVGAGTFAEYVCAPEGVLGPKPVNLTFEQAAAVPMAGLTALQGLRDKGRIRAGQKVLVTGASGGVGTFAVQLAKHFGADVTGVCSTGNVELVRSLGADHVIDYTKEHFYQRGQRWDLLFDNAGTHTVAQARRALTRRGTLVPNNGSVGGRWLGSLPRGLPTLVIAPFLSQRIVGMWLAHTTTADLVVLKDLIESGAVRTVVDRTYHLGDVPDAIRYVEQGHTRGKVVVTV